MYQITLRAARVNKGYTLEEAAREVNKNPKTLAKYEEDSSEIPRSLFLSLVGLYGVPEELVFCGNESVIIGFKRSSKRKNRAS